MVAFSLRNLPSQAFLARFFVCFLCLKPPNWVVFLIFLRLNATVFHTKCNPSCYCCIYFENLRHIPAQPPCPDPEQSPLSQYSSATPFPFSCPFASPSLPSHVPPPLPKLSSLTAFRIKKAPRISQGADNLPPVIAKAPVPLVFARSIWHKAR